MYTCKKNIYLTIKNYSINIKINIKIQFAVLKVKIENLIVNLHFSV